MYSCPENWATKGQMHQHGVWSWIYIQAPCLYQEFHWLSKHVHATSMQQSQLAFNFINHSWVWNRLYTHSLLHFYQILYKVCTAFLSVIHSTIITLRFSCHTFAALSQPFPCHTFTPLSQPWVLPVTYSLHCQPWVLPVTHSLHWHNHEFFLSHIHSTVTTMSSSCHTFTPLSQPWVLPITHSLHCQTITPLLI